MFIVFVGPPGVGKGTQCRLLAQKLDLLHLSTGEVLRQAIQDENELGKKAAQYIDDGRLVPDDIMVKLIDEQAIGRKHGCLLDGFPRTLVQAEALDQLLRKRQQELLIVVQLLADREEVLSRLSARARIESRSDDSPATIERRLEIFDRQTAPIVEFYRNCGLLAEINGIGKPEEVHVRVLDRVREAIDLAGKR
ncbi:MAG: adenylate kinase [Planctomycetales bacterium]|nr:adenylate kinase [Planctomycetales bacterium]